VSPWLPFFVGSGIKTARPMRNKHGERTHGRGGHPGYQPEEKPGARGNGVRYRFLHWRYTGSSTDPNQRAFVIFNGRILAEYYGGSPPGAIFDHPDEIGSATTSSDYTGKTINEKLFYPFGELWTGAAIPNLNMHQTFAQLPDYDSETDQYNTPNRHYNPTGRWLSPDPGGLKAVKLDDPQTWNMYAYVRNNPTTATDPTGLDLWLKGCHKSDKKHCHKGYLGSWDDAHNQFTRTHVSGDLTGSATLGPNGISVRYNGQTYAGVWDRNKGESAAAYVAGAGALKGYTAQITGACENNSCLASGTLYKQANSPLYRDPAAAVSSSLSSELRQSGSGYVMNPKLDFADFEHPGQVNFRGYDEGQPGLPSTHITPDISPVDNSWVQFHVDARFAYEDLSGFFEHAGSLLKSILP
jgi:RHS repeat-associated protein